MDQQVNARPALPSIRLGRPISSDLERILMKCLEKDPQQRPQTAEVLESALASSSEAKAWTPDQSRQWWDQHLAGLELRPAATMPEKTLIIAPRNQPE